ncbi:MAG: response regulator [Planctomycetota bacterium]
MSSDATPEPSRPEPSRPEPSRPEPSRPEPSGPEPLADEIDLEGLSVLVVDDDPEIRDSFEAAFLASGAETETVGDGNDAVRICQEDPPHLVVLDMMLPGRSGFLALEKIKGREDSPRVIMVTANEGKRHQEYAEAIGVDAYLQKPVPLDELLRTALRLWKEG